MNFLTIIVRGLWRRPVRTALTLAGISVGIAAVIALVGMSSGYEKSVDKQLEVIGIDIIVSNDLSGGVMPKPFDAGDEATVAALPEVKETTSLLMQMMGVEEAPMMMVSGRQWGGFTWDQMSLVEGRMPKDGDDPVVVLGIIAAEHLGKKVGDTVLIEADEFEVAGIFDGHSVVENGAVILSLSQFQKAVGLEGKINFIDVRVEEGSTKESVTALCRKIEEVLPEKRAVMARDVVGTSMGYRIIKAMSWSTSLLAIIVGVLGVMNTMLMTVFERTHEIGILLALGWKRMRIVLLVLYESAILGFLGGVFGVLVGWGALAILKQTPTIRGLLEPDLGPDLILKAIAIAVVVGVVSGLYPAWRSSRMTPSLALQA